MQNLLLQFSKTTIAFVAIALGIVGIIAMNPPHTVCDTQEKLFKKSQLGNIFPKPSKNGKLMMKPLVFNRVEDCKMSNSPGGCFEAFASFERLLEGLRHVPTECEERVGKIPQVNQVLLGGLKLMADLAWGDEPPGEGADRYGFLSSAELYLFCQMQTSALKLYGKEAFHKFRNSVMAQHKGAKGLEVNDIWNRSIFSTRCSTFY